MKKSLVTTCIILAVLILSGSAFAAEAFSDVQQKDWFYQDVTDLNRMGIISGMGDGTFHPLDPVRVDEFVKLIVCAGGFPETPGNVYWAQPFLDEALSQGLILPDEFPDPTRAIRRGEMARIIVRALDETATSAMYGHAFFMLDYLDDRDDDVLAAFYLGIITGYPDGAFHPGNPATRAEASAMLMRMLFENRRIETNRYAVLEENLAAIRAEYGALKEEYLALYAAGIDPDPYVFDNGDKLYEGSPGGIDAYLWADGNLYIGPVEQGHFGGLGYFQWTDGSDFIGEIEDDKRTGLGVMTYADAVYVGDFMEGELTGQAILEWIDGYRFIGSFVEGQVQGLAKRITPDGVVTIGQFTDGLPDGMALNVDPSGISYFGSYEAGDMDYDEAILFEWNTEGLPFRQRIQEVLDEALTPQMTRDDQIRALHDYLVRSVNYDEEGYDSGNIPYISHTAYGALMDGSAVCDGYATAFNLLLNELGIESDLVYGTADGESHAWNLVAFSDGNYFVDVTWDDGDNHTIYSSYFKKTLSQMNQDHVLEVIIP